MPTLKERIAEMERARHASAITHETPHEGLVVVKPGIYQNPKTGQEFKLDEKNIPNLGKLLSTGKLKRVAGTRRRRRRSRRNIK